MDLFEIQPETDLQKTFLQQFHKKVSIQDNQHNYKIFGFDKCFTKRCKSLFKNFAIPYQQINQFDNKQLISSCECLDCGGKVNKKILVCKKELIDQQQLNNKSRLPASPQLSIQPQNVRPSNRDLSLIGSSAHFSINFIYFYHSKQTIQKSNRVSIMPVIQLIQASNLMKKISTTDKIEKDLKTKMSISTHSLFNKVQQKMIINKDHDTDILKQVLEIENNKKEETNKLHKLTPICGQFRIKTESSNYYFASIKQKRSVNNIPNLCPLENIKKNNLSIFESKTPRLLLARSEKYNQKQPLTQRLMCTYLKKQNTNSKLIKSNNKA